MTLNGAIATNRFGLGAKPGEIDAASANPVAWLKAQIDPKIQPRIQGEGMVTSHGILSEIDLLRKSIRRKPEEEMKKARKQGRARINGILRAEVEARTKFGVATQAPFHERLTRFWANHFTVSARDRDVLPLAGAYEREAIRPNILGSFSDLAFAAVGHQAMIIYLDNRRSIGPNSARGRRGNGGLNENLAREVMELHTVSPDAGYTQQDVEEFAKALTGWTIGLERHGPDQHGKTIFINRLHEPGTRRVLGTDYPQRGADQASAILTDLCAHPATARHVCYKLAAHFVSDTPPKALVDRMSNTFISSYGNLQAVYLTLIESPEAWSPDAMKVKTPDELLTSTARMIGMPRTFVGKVRDVFASFAQQAFQASSPEGWPDDAASWLGPDSVLKRVEWANRLAERAPGLDARAFLQASLGDRLTERTLQIVEGAESGEQAMVLALMSPDFQRR
ncbi:MAG: DUF1800 domain-containing protein [Pseudomonadota bacterium]